MNTYLFFYAFGSYGSTYAKGKGNTPKEGLKDAFDNYSVGIGGPNPSAKERKEFLREAILISTFTAEGEVIENEGSIELMAKVLS